MEDVCCSEVIEACMDTSWESFHARDNATARFYKERRYLLLEFPALSEANMENILEIGCGCGSSLLPVLKANPGCRVTGTDVSPTAVQLFTTAARTAGVSDDRVCAFTLDSTDPQQCRQMYAGMEADGCLIIFTLAALLPHLMHTMLDAAFQALRSGGRLFFRDHGLLDTTHIRQPPEQRLGHRLYRRQDGTSCYFFSVEDLQSRAEKAGFVTEECKYACVSLVNRKNKVGMKRVFVHGQFRKP